MARRRKMSVLEEYDLLIPLLTAFTGKLSALVSDLLIQHGLRVHSVTCRVKERDSLARKLARPEKAYSSLADITDVCGIRVTTYFADQVDRVAEVIAREFDVDEANSLDKRASLDPDRFGYLSMHHVVMLLPQRIALTEYAAFANLKAEIQTRSILQHAWAEIEHDLGYKTSHEVPRSIRRRFSRLAGLLELVDQEFERIRDELDVYEKEVPRRIAEDPGAVALDKASLASFAASSPIVEEVDRAIGSLRNRRVRNVSARLIELAVARLQALEVHSIRDVELALKEYREEIIAFADEMLPRTGATKTVDYIGGGISIFYLCYVLPFHSANPDALNRLAAVVSSEASAPATAKRLTKLRADAEAKLKSQQSEPTKPRRGRGTPARSKSGTDKRGTKAKGDGR